MSHIPIILNNRNRLTSTRNMVDDLVLLGYTNLYILDMCSTYPPLIEYYENCPAEIIYLQDNIGHKALWNSDVLRRFSDYPFIAYSDSDIELNKLTQPGFIENMIKVAKDYRMDKVGLAIQLKDIPDTKANRRILQIEAPYWNSKIPSMELEIYNAMVDTTFCVVRTDRPCTLRALRVGGDYTCRHLPWYLDYNNLSEEEQYYIDHADNRFASYKKLLSI